MAPSSKPQFKMSFSSINPNINPNMTTNPYQIYPSEMTANLRTSINQKITQRLSIITIMNTLSLTSRPVLTSNYKLSEASSSSSSSFDNIGGIGGRDGLRQSAVNRFSNCKDEFNSSGYDERLNIGTHTHNPNPNPSLHRSSTHTLRKDDYHDKSVRVYNQSLRVTQNNLVRQNTNQNAKENENVKENEKEKEIKKYSYILKQLQGEIDALKGELRLHGLLHNTTDTPDNNSITPPPTKTNMNIDEFKILTTLNRNVNKNDLTLTLSFPPDYKYLVVSGYNNTTNRGVGNDFILYAGFVDKVCCLNVFELIYFVNNDSGNSGGGGVKSKLDILVDFIQFDVTGDRVYIDVDTLSNVISGSERKICDVNCVIDCYINNDASDSTTDCEYGNGVTIRIAPTTTTSTSTNEQDKQTIKINRKQIEILTSAQPSLHVTPKQLKWKHMVLMCEFLVSRLCLLPVNANSGNANSRGSGDSVKEKEFSVNNTIELLQSRIRDRGCYADGFNYVIKVRLDTGDSDSGDSGEGEDEGVVIDFYYDDQFDVNNANDDDDDEGRIIHTLKLSHAEFKCFSLPSKHVTVTNHDNDHDNNDNGGVLVYNDNETLTPKPDKTTTESESESMVIDTKLDYFVSRLSWTQPLSSPPRNTLKTIPMAIPIPTLAMNRIIHKDAVTVTHEGNAVELTCEVHGGKCDVLVYCYIVTSSGCRNRIERLFDCYYEFDGLIDLLNVHVHEREYERERERARERGYLKVSENRVELCRLLCKRLTIINTVGNDGCKLHVKPSHKTDPNTNMNAKTRLLPISITTSLNNNNKTGNKNSDQSRNLPSNEVIGSIKITKTTTLHTLRHLIDTQLDLPPLTNLPLESANLNVNVNGEGYRFMYYGVVTGVRQEGLRFAWDYFNDSYSSDAASASASCEGMNGMCVLILNRNYNYNSYYDDDDSSVNGSVNSGLRKYTYNSNSGDDDDNDSEFGYQQSYAGSSIYSYDGNGSSSVSRIQRIKNIRRLKKLHKNMSGVKGNNGIGGNNDDTGDGVDSDISEVSYFDDFDPSKDKIKKMKSMRKKKKKKKRRQKSGKTSQTFSKGSLFKKVILRDGNPEGDDDDDDDESVTPLLSPTSKTPNSLSPFNSPGTNNSKNVTKSKPKVETVSLLIHSYVTLTQGSRYVSTQIDLSSSKSNIINRGDNLTFGSSTNSKCSVYKEWFVSSDEDDVFDEKGFWLEESYLHKVKNEVIVNLSSPKATAAVASSRVTPLGSGRMLTPLISPANSPKSSTARSRVNGKNMMSYEDDGDSDDTNATNTKNSNNNGSNSKYKTGQIFTLQKIWKQIPKSSDVRPAWLKQYEDGCVPWVVEYTNTTAPSSKKVKLSEKSKVKLKTSDNMLFVNWFGVKLGYDVLEGFIIDVYGDGYGYVDHLDHLDTPPINLVNQKQKQTRIHQQRSQTFPTVPPTVIIRQAYDTVNLIHPVSTGIDSTKWSKFVKELGVFQSNLSGNGNAKVKSELNSTSVDLTFARVVNIQNSGKNASKERKLTFAGFKDACSDLASLLFPDLIDIEPDLDLDEDINGNEEGDGEVDVDVDKYVDLDRIKNNKKTEKALIKLTTKHISMHPAINLQIWFRAKTQAIKTEGINTCAAIRICSFARRNKSRFVYLDLIQRVIRLQGFGRMCNARGRFRAVELGIANAFVFRLRYKSALLVQNVYRLRFYRSQHLRRLFLILEDERRRTKEHLKTLHSAKQKYNRSIILKLVKVIQGMTTLITITRLNNSTNSTDYSILISVYLPSTQATFKFTLEEGKLREIMCINLSCIDVSVSEMYASSALVNLTSRLTLRLSGHRPIVLFTKRSTNERGLLVSKCGLRLGRTSFSSSSSSSEVEVKVKSYSKEGLYVVHVYRSNDDYVFNAYDCRTCRWLRCSVEFGVLKGWLGEEEKKGKRSKSKGKGDVKDGVLLLTNTAENENENEEQAASSKSKPEPNLLHPTNQPTLTAYLLTQLTTLTNPHTKATTLHISHELDSTNTITAASRVQGLYHMLIAKRVARGKCKGVYEMIWDNAYNSYSYIDLRNGRQSWSKPKVLGKFDDLDKPKNEWRTIHNGNGDVYYMNPATGKTSWLSTHDAAIRIQRLTRVYQAKYIGQPLLTHIKLSLKFTETAEKNYNNDNGKLSNIVNYALYNHAVLNDFDAARRCYKDGLKLSSNNPVLNRAYGIFVLCTNESPRRKTEGKANDLFHTAKLSDPTLNKFDAALKAFFHYSLIVDPWNVWKMLNYAIVLQCVLGEYEVAEKVYLRALGVEPMNGNVIANYNTFEEQRLPGGIYATPSSANANGKGCGPGNVIIKRSELHKRDDGNWGMWRMMVDRRCKYPEFMYFWYNVETKVAVYDEPDFGV